MVNFPTSLDTLTNPTSTDTTAGVDHAAQHTNANDAIEALEAKVGVDNSAVTTSLDYKLKSTSSISPGHKHVLSEITDYAAASDASTSVKGVTRMSVAPASASIPIAVGDNDGRVPTQNENDALVGTSGTAVSSSNKLVDAADVSSAGASGKIVRLNATAYPAGDGSAITGVPSSVKVSQSTTAVSVTNTTTETDLVSFTVPANTLGTGGVLHVAGYISDLDITGGNSPILRFKYGSTTIASVTVTTSGTPSNCLGQFDFYLHGDGGTSAQKGRVHTILTTNGGTLPPTADDTFQRFVAGTAAIDSTSNQTFKVTVEWNTASASNNITVHSYVANKII